MELSVGDLVLYTRDRDRLFGRLVSFHERTGLWRIARWDRAREFDWLDHTMILTSAPHEDKNTEDVVRRDEIGDRQITTFREPSGQEEPRWRYSVRVAKRGTITHEVDCASGEAAQLEHAVHLSAARLALEHSLA